MIYIKDMFARWQSINGVMYVANSKQQTFKLDDIGIEIWNYLDGEKSTEEICEKISKKYSIDIETVSKDVDKFIEQMKKNDLIKNV